LFGADRKWLAEGQTGAFDPERTFAASFALDRLSRVLQAVSRGMQPSTIRALALRRKRHVNRL
jgi:hypothetical protein